MNLQNLVPENINVTLIYLLFFQTLTVLLLPTILEMIPSGNQTAGIKEDDGRMESAQLKLDSKLETGHKEIIKREETKQGKMFTPKFVVSCG